MPVEYNTVKHDNTATVTAQPDVTVPVWKTVLGYALTPLVKLIQRLWGRDV